jgi:hypothetical protein
MSPSRECPFYRKIQAPGLSGKKEWLRVRKAEPVGGPVPTDEGDRSEVADDTVAADFLVHAEAL